MKGINNEEFPKIGVIIPAYNAEKYIERCVKSIIVQTYTNWCAYVVNDGSTDNTENVLENLRRIEARLLYKNQKNMGVFSARREAIDMASDCQYITFLDSDDYFTDNMLFENAINKLKKEKAECLCFNYTVNEGKGGFLWKSTKILTNNVDKIGNMLSGRMIDGNMPYCFYNYDIVKSDFKIYDYNNDDFMNKYSFLIHSSRVVYVPWKSYCYFENVESQTHQKIREKDLLYYEHAKHFTDEVLKLYPQLQDECEYFRCWVLLWLVLQVMKDKKACKGMDLYLPLMKLFKENRKVYTRNKFFCFRDKMNAVLVQLGLYTYAYTFYHRIKKKR